MRYEMSLTSGEEGLGEFTRNIRAVLIGLFPILMKDGGRAGPDMTIPLVNRKLVVGSLLWPAIARTRDEPRTTTLESPKWMSSFQFFVTLVKSYQTS